MNQENITLNKVLEVSDAYVLHAAPYKILLFQNGDKWSWAISDESHKLRSSSHRMINRGFVSFDVAVRTANIALIGVQHEDELDQSRALLDPLDDSSLLKRVMTRDKHSLYELMLAAQDAIRKSHVRTEIAS